MKRTHPMHDRIRRWLKAMFDWHRPKEAPPHFTTDDDGRLWLHATDEWMKNNSATHAWMTEQQRRLRQMG